MLRKSLIALMACVLLTGSAGVASPIDGAISRAGAWLVDNQNPGGDWGEFGFTGECLIGLVNAYEVTGNTDYLDAAEGAATYAVYDEGGYNAGTGTYTDGLFASASYGLTRLSGVNANPANNIYRTAVMDDFDGLDPTATISWYRTSVEDSYALLDLSRYTVSAFAVDDEDKAEWRDGLIQALWDLDDSDDAPVMALGAATWALAQTGGLPSGITVSIHGQATTLDELPGMLAGHQMGDG
ncbi:hypothetical protein LCGC14_1742530, partial [marine sediment metagenome]